MNTLLLDDPVLTAREVAEYLQISKSKIYYLISRKQIPHIRIGKNVRVRQSDLVKWISQKLTADTSNF